MQLNRSGQDNIETDVTPRRVRCPPRPRLVLAEDCDEIRLTLGELFTRDGFDVTCVSDGSLLVEHLAQCELHECRPDIIVTDHQMPGCTGIEILELLRDIDLQIPVIVVTAFRADIGELASGLGACAVFDKPFDPDDVRTAAMCSIDWSDRGV